MTLWLLVPERLICVFRETADLLGTDRKFTDTNIITFYNCGQQKCITEHVYVSINNMVINKIEFVLYLFYSFDRKRLIEEVS